MSALRRWMLHRAWVPAVVLVTLVLFVPRAITVIGDSSRVTHAAGVYAWEQAPPNASGDSAFRWTKGRAALREPVHGAVMTVPVYLARPDIATGPVTLQVTIDGVTSDPVVFTKNGWQTLTYDLVALLGGDRWRAARAVTLELAVSPVVIPAALGPSDDTRELGIGIGVVRWGGAVPESVVEPHGNPS